MDVSSFQLEGEWLELEVESEKGERSLRFKIKPLSAKDQLDLGDIARKDVKDLLSYVSGIVIDWDLTEGGKKLPCTDKAKEKYLPYLIGMTIKKKEEEKRREEGEVSTDKGPGEIRSFVGLEILSFAQNFDNFIKN